MRYVLLLFLLSALAGGASAVDFGNGSLTVHGTGNWVNARSANLITPPMDLTNYNPGGPVAVGGWVDLREAVLPDPGWWSKFYFMVRMKDASAYNRHLAISFGSDWLGVWRGIPAQPWDRIRYEFFCQGEPVYGNCWPKGGPEKYYCTVGGFTDDTIPPTRIYPSDRIYYFQSIADWSVSPATWDLWVYGKGHAGGNEVDYKQWYHVGRWLQAGSSPPGDFRINQTNIQDFYLDLWGSDLLGVGQTAKVSWRGLRVGPPVPMDQPPPPTLTLVPTHESIYIKPGESILVNMNVSDLQTKVNACQAILGYSSTYFADPPNTGCVEPGGGVWDLVIWDSWRDSTGTPGEIDTAIGVDAQGAVGTDADATICKITLTSKSGVEGVTQMVFQPDVSDVKATFLSDMNANPVWPAKVNSTNIYIDGTAPVVTSFSADPLCTKTTTTLTFAVADADSPGKSGVDYVDVYVGDDLVAHDVTSPYVLDMSGYATETCHAVKLRVYDKAGNYADSNPENVCIDKTAPTISNIRAEQPVGTSVLCGSGNNAVQGVVDIFVDVVDPGCATLVVPPTVEVAGITPVDYVGVVGDTYHYQVTVLPTTGNGSHTITVSAQDSLGNSSSDNSKSVCVDKNQVTGTVSFGTLSSESYSVTRDVVFIATDAGGGVLKTWTIPVLFTNDTGTQVASGTYKLTLVPAGMVNLSAKNAWTLRKKQACSLDGDGQASANFTLLGGDINNSNTINILDYSLLKIYWLNAKSGWEAADVNGNGAVNADDYNIMKLNWFKVGDNP